MSTQIQLPASNLVTGKPAPAADMDKIVAALTAMSATSFCMPTGDETGVSDAANISAALAAGNVAVLAPGRYYLIAALTAAPPVTIIGAGKDQVTLNFTGSGDCLRINTTGAEAGFSRAVLEGFTIDGTDASAGAAGLHMGDLIQGHLDIAVQNFQGTNSKNVWFDNQYNYTEQLTGRLYVRDGTANVVFDNSANPNGTATNSFDRTDLDIFIISGGVGDGIVFQNGALIFDGRLGYHGNFSPGSAQYSAVKFAAAPSYSFTATNASPCVFTAAGSYYSDGVPVTLSGGSLPAGFTALTYFVVNASGDTFELAATSGGSPINSTSTGSGNVVLFQQSSILQSTLEWGVELGGSGTYAPYTINFGAAAKTVIAGCKGIMDFGANLAFANAVNATNSFQFEGPVFGDSVLWRSRGGTNPFNAGSGLSDGGNIATVNDVITINPTSNLTGMIMLKWAVTLGTPTQVTVINRSSSFTITMAASGTSNVANGTDCVILPNSSMTFWWDEFASLWEPAQQPAPGRFLCPPTAYAPSGVTNLTTTSATLAGVTGAASTVAAGSNGGEISAIAAWVSPSAGVLDVANGTLFPAAGGTVTVAASGPTTAVVTYTGVSGNSLTGCAYVSGSATGTVATGGAVTLTSSAGTTGNFTAPASGSVVVTANCAANDSTGGATMAFALAANGTVSPVIGNVLTFHDSAASTTRPYSMPFVVTELTPGTSYNFGLLFATSAGTLEIQALGQTSVTPTGSTGIPVTMTVQAV